MPDPDKPAPCLIRGLPHTLYGACTVLDTVTSRSILYAGFHRNDRLTPDPVFGLVMDSAPAWSSCRTPIRGEMTALKYIVGGVIIGNPSLRFKRFTG